MKNAAAISILWFITLNYCIAQQSSTLDYLHFRPFDSIGVFQEKIVIWYDSLGPPIYGSNASEIDSITGERLAVLAKKMSENERVVVVFLLHNYYLNDDHYGGATSRWRSRRLKRNAIFKDIDKKRIQFEPPHRTRNGVPNEVLLPEDCRLEILVYELPPTKQE